MDELIALEEHAARARERLTTDRTAGLGYAHRVQVLLGRRHRGFGAGTLDAGPGLLDRLELRGLGETAHVDRAPSILRGGARSDRL